MNQHALAVRRADAELVGILVAAQKPGPVVVYVHGASEGTRDAPLARHLMETLPEAGIAVLAFDRRGEGASTGEPRVSIEMLADDVCAWLERLRAHPQVDPGRIGLFAHSQGGWIAPLAAAADQRVACLVAVSPSGVTPGEQMNVAVTNLLREARYDEATVERVLALRALETAALRGEVSVWKARAAIAAASEEPWFELAFLGDPGEPKAETWLEWVDFDVRPTLDALELPALLVVGGHDRWVPVEETLRIWQSALGNRLTVLSLPEAGHYPTSAADAHDWLERGPILLAYERALLEWLRSHLGG